MSERPSTWDWRKLPLNQRPYDAYINPRYVVAECDHHGPYCKCDPPFWLRESTETERGRYP